MIVTPDDARMKVLQKRAGRLVQELTAEGFELEELVALASAVISGAISTFDPEDKIVLAEGLRATLRKSGIFIDQHGRIVVGARA